MSNHTEYEFDDQDNFERASRFAQKCWDDNMGGRRPELCTLQISLDRRTLLVAGAEGAPERFTAWMAKKGIAFTKVDPAES